jgi:hypothetical protein
MSNLAALRREIERMAALARETRPSQCKCRYLTIVESEPLSEEQAQILESNHACYELNHSHTGFAYIEVPAA